MVQQGRRRHGSGCRDVCAGPGTGTSGASASCCVSSTAGERKRRGVTVGRGCSAGGARGQGRGQCQAQRSINRRLRCATASRNGAQIAGPSWSTGSSLRWARRGGGLRRAASSSAPRAASRPLPRWARLQRAGRITREICVIRTPRHDRQALREEVTTTRFALLARK